jgi:MoaA/NifB/PqqE/SkfB family radical SAM enzyme
VNNKPFCTVPFTRAFVLNNGAYRDCCAAFPEIVSRPNESFVQWWSGDQLTAIRNSLWTAEFPLQCKNCEIQEHIHHDSLRLAANKNIGSLNEAYSVPDTWHVMFGNKCNIACWTCNEGSSSLIAQHKRNIDILPENFVDPNKEFSYRWAELKASILDSYNHHESIRISILGGEPIYNKDVIEFLEYLITQGLSTRTILEFTTNGTILGERLIKLFGRSQWKYICAFISVDAIGKSAEWIRYNSIWSNIEENIMQYRATVNYTEIQTTLSILNLIALPNVVDFCSKHNLSHNIFMLSDPNFMDIRNWDGNNIIDYHPFTERKLDKYLDLLGSNKVLGTANQLRAYIQQFSQIRRPLDEFDPILARFLGLS